MSFARKRENQEQAEEFKQRPKIDHSDMPTQERLNYLETAISKLQYQQDSLLPLLKLTESIPSLQKVETMAKQVAQKYREIEESLKNQDSQIKELKQSTQNLFSQTDQSINEEVAKRERDTNNMVSHVVELENRFKQLELENQMSIKNLQIQTKEEIIQVVQNFDEKVHGVKDQFSNLSEELLKQQNNKKEKTMEQLGDLKTKFEDYKSQVDQQMGEMNQEIEPKVQEFLASADQQMEQFKQKMLEQMTQKVEQSIKSARKEIITKFNTFNFKFSSEVINLRSDIEKLRDIFEDKFKGDLLEQVLNQPPDKKIIDLNQEMRRRLDNLQQYSYSTLDHIQSVITQVQEALMDFSDNIGLALQQYKKQQDQEQFRFEKQNEFEETIISCKEQISTCQQQLESTSQKNQADLFKLTEAAKLVEELKVQLTRVAENESFDKKNQIKKEIDIADVQNVELQNLKKELSNRIESMQKEVVALDNRLHGLSKQAARELDMTDLSNIAQSPQRKQLYQSGIGEANQLIQNYLFKNAQYEVIHSEPLSEYAKQIYYYLQLYLIKSSSSIYKLYILSPLLNFE